MKNLLYLLCFLPVLGHSQIKIAEFVASNTGQIMDEDGDKSDWIELYNTGVNPVELAGYSLSDKNDAGAWIFPSLSLAPSERLLLFASGKNRGAISNGGGIDHWETALNEGDSWRYFVGNQAPPANWNMPDFQESLWLSGPGGFGYGDSDDATQTPTGIPSFYFRKTFDVPDPSKIIKGILSIDYDDGFIAYLNGVEIARSNNLPAGMPANTVLASPEHEALMYGGGLPESHEISASFINTHLKSGQNVLAIQVHNTALSSSDLTARAWLHFGISGAQPIYGPNPPWFSPLGGGGPNVELHSDFKISYGEKLFLFDANGALADSVSVPYLEPGHSRARINDDGGWCISPTPSPDAANGGACESGYAAAPQFVLPPGFYSNNQSVGIVSGPGTVHFSTDGSIPDLNDPVYLSPILLSKTTVIKARRFETYKLPSVVSTGTYFIGENIRLPVVSVSFEPEQFDEVYTNYSAKTSATVEYFDKNKQRQFAQKSSAYVAGNWSVAFPQKSLQFDSEEEYGALGPFNYPLFSPDKPISSYRSFRIRNEDDDFSLARMRDRVVNQLALPTHTVAAGNSNVIAFINGEYWGLYSGRERLDNYFCRDNFGCDPDSVTMIKTHFGQDPYQAEYGNLDEFYQITDFMATEDLSLPANYQYVSERVDLENFTDYFATEIYVASTDWLQDYFNNIRLFTCSQPRIKWKFMLWDVSYSSGAGSGCVNCDVLQSTINDPFDTRYGKMFNGLLKNQDFKHYFINRSADLMNEHFLPAKAHTIIEQNATEMAPEIQRHHELWGTGDSLFWREQVQSLKDFYSGRSDFQRDFIVNDFNLQGKTNIQLDVNPPGSGVIKISTLTPQNYPWNGVYFKGIPVTVTAIPSPGFSFSNWLPNALISNAALAGQKLIFNLDSHSLTANFTGVVEAAKLAVSEINYHSADNADAGDWLELVNYGNNALDLSGYVLRDENWYKHTELPLGTVLLPNSYLILAADTTLFANRFPQTGYAPLQLDFDLSNKSDEVHILDRFGVEKSALRYSDKNPWPESPDGDGYTLEKKNYESAPNDPQNWFAGCPEGSPARAYDPDCFVSVSNPGDLEQMTLHVFPNPAQEWIQVNTAESMQSIRIYDLMGRLVAERTIAATEGNVDTSLLQSGIYTVEIEISGKKIRKNLAIIR